MTVKERQTDKTTDDVSPQNKEADTREVNEPQALSPPRVKLTPAECAVVIAIDILQKAGKPTTPREIANLLMEDVQTVRNILERLRNKGLVVSSLAFGLAGLARMGSQYYKVSGREKVYKLVDSIEDIIDKHKEILDWATVTLGIKKDKNELIEYINSRAEEITSRQDNKSSS